MANPEHLSILTQGVETWNAWRQANESILPDLTEADLFEARRPAVLLTCAMLF